MENNTDVDAAPLPPHGSTAVWCCGHDRQTRYCPDCGKQLGSEFDLWGLLSHCDDHATKQERRAKDSLRYQGRQREGHQQQMERAAIKWRTWATMLRAMLESR